MNKPNPKSVYSLIVLFTIIITPFLPLVPMAKAQTTVLSIEPASTTGLFPGDSFAVNIWITGVADLKSWQFKIAFSGVREDVLMVTEVFEGDFLMGVGSTYFASNIDNSAGVVQAAANIIGALPGAYGDGLLATVFFEVLGGGESPLDLYDTILLDSTSTPISHDAIDGSYVGAAPYAYFGYRPYPSLDGYGPAVNQTITFNATSSYDPSGGTIVSYEWDFDNDDPGNTPETTTDPIITHTYVGDRTAAKTYGVNLTVTSSTDYKDSFLFTDLTLVVRDISVRIMSVSPVGLIKAGTPVSIYVNATNIGTGTENFNVTTYYNDVPINTTRVLALNPIPIPYQPPFYHVKAYTVNWDTTGLPTDVYTIKVVATTNPIDNNMTNNEMIWGDITISMFSRLIYDVTVYGKTFKVGLETDSTVSGFGFDYANKRFAFDAEGPEGLLSYSNVTIPMNMLNVSDPMSWIVELNGVSEDYIATSNGTHYFVYFDYVFASTFEVFVTGDVVPIPPQPVLSLSPTRGTVGQPIAFDGSLTTDPDGSGIVSYYWRVYRYDPQGLKINVWSRTTTVPTQSVVFNQSYYGNTGLFVTVKATNAFGMSNESSEVGLEVLWPYDIAVVDIDVSEASVNIGQSVFINVTVTSVLDVHGDLMRFRVTIYGNDTALTTVLVNPNIQPPEINVPAVGVLQRADYRWNTTGVSLGTYVIKATASVILYGSVAPPLPPEVNLADNTLTYGDVTVTKWGSTLDIVVSPSTLNYGQQTIVSGSISPVRGDVNVTVQYRLGTTGAWSDAGKVRTSAQGTYLFNWKPTTAGTYEVRTSWDGDSITFGNASAVKTLTVRKAASTLSINVDSTSVTAGSTVTISGAVTPTIAGATVTISVNKDGAGWTTAGTATTDAEGNYEYDWTPSEAGTYQVRVTWDGNVNANGSESEALTVTVSPGGMGDIYLYVAAGAVILIAVVAVIFFLRRKK